MVTTKNVSTGLLALYAAILVSLLAGACFFIFAIYWEYALMATACVFVFSFFVFKAVLHRFLFRKIKLIYKFIYQTKASKREEMYYKYILPQKSIQDVEEDVQAWAHKQNEEIASLRSMEKYRKEFLQNFSHEIKTPIFAVQGYLDTLLSGDLNDKELTKKFLTNASRNIDRMVHLVSDIDEIAKLESGKQPMNKSLFVVQDLIKDTFDNLPKEFLGKSVHFSIKQGCETPVQVFADKEKIAQVFTNLFHNAIKYGAHSVEIIASVYKLDGDKALIEISDNGVGISEGHLSRIFERFYRTDAGRSRNDGGTGLGLAICKHIIEAHQETIHIRSKENVGTTVGFTLPLKKD